jgi:hypothetical protein
VEGQSRFLTNLADEALVGGLSVFYVTAYANPFGVIGIVRFLGAMKHQIRALMNEIA